MLRLVAILISFTNINDAAVAQSLQTRTALLSHGDQPQLNFTPRNTRRRYSQLARECGDYRPSGGTAPRCRGACGASLQCVFDGSDCSCQ